MEESHEFSRWMFGMSVSQLCALELKAQMLSEGDVMSSTWTIVYDLVDDQPDAHKITGSWTGPVIMK